MCRSSTLKSQFVGVACAVLFSTCAGAQTPDTHEHRFSGAEHWAQIFDDPKRDAWQKPHEVIQTLALKPDAVVADIGAGTGYFPGDPRLPAKVDVVLMVDVYHHIGDRDAYFRKLRESLKPGGRVSIIDFRMDSPEGPPKSSRIPADRVKAELEKAGYALVAEHAFLPRQYFLVFRVSK